MIYSKKIRKHANVYYSARVLKDELKQFLSDPNQSIEFPQYERPLVSIIVVTYNKAEYTLRCLRSLLSHADVPYHVIIVDNASSDESSLLFERVALATLIRNSANLDFIHACNQAAQPAQGAYLLFLNNDASLTHATLSALVDTMEHIPNAGAVGAKLVYPSGLLQEAGSIIWRDGSALGYGRGEDPDKGEYCYVREVDYCSGACLLVRKDLFERLGGFDPRYFPAYYEDSDLCMGVRSLGYKVLFQPKAVAIHHEFTSGSSTRAELLCQQNRPRFEAKWRQALATQLPPPPSRESILSARDRRLGKRILLFDDRIPTPDRGSGFPRMFSMLNYLAGLGYSVTFTPVQDTTRWEPDTGKLQQVGVEVLYGPIKLAKLLESRKTLYDIVIVSRPHNAVLVMPFAWKFLPDATFIYDAEALFYQRDILRAQVEGRASDSKHIAKLKQLELELIAIADKVIAVSESERESIASETARYHELFVWGHAHEPYVPSTCFSDRRDILFVGGFLGSASPNEDAIVHFARNVFPRIQQHLPDVRLLVAGGNPPQAVLRLASPSMMILGHVASLREYYESCRLLVVPLRYGAGISHKLTEGMSFGIPAVVSALAANGLAPQEGEEVLICNSDQAFVEKTVRLYQDENLWMKVQHGALKYIEKNCHPDRMRESLLHILESPSRGDGRANGSDSAARLKMVRRWAREAVAPISRTPWYRLPNRAWHYYQNGGTRAVLSKTRYSIRTRWLGM